jgi:hypothetical protein
MLSLLSKKNCPLVPTSTSAIPVLLAGLLSQPCTVCVMSINRKSFKLALETVIGLAAVAEAPKGGRELYVRVDSVHVGDDGRS